MTDQMQIVSVEISNVMGIKSARFEPEDKTSVIYGDNGGGKTSLVKALRAGFKGLPAELVTKGEDTASVLLRLAGRNEAYQIKRQQGPGGAKLEVRDGEGNSLPKPSKILQGLIGDFGLDPGKFALASGEEQVRMFCESFPVDLQIAGADVKAVCDEYGVTLNRNGFLALKFLEERVCEHRKTKGKEKRAALAVAAEFKPADAGLTRRPEGMEAAREAVRQADISLGTIQEKTESVRARNAGRQQKYLALQRAEAKPQELTAAYDAEEIRIKAQIASLEKHLDDLASKYNHDFSNASGAIEVAEKSLSDAGFEEVLPDSVAAQESLRQRREALTKEETHDRVCDGIDRYKDKIAIAEALNDEWLILDELINEKIRGVWMRGLWRQIDAPIDGLSLGQNGKGKDCLCYQQNKDLEPIPLSETNTAARIQVGVKICAVLNAKYPVKIIAVDDGEHLTRPNRAALIREAEEAGFQVLMLIAEAPEDVPDGELLVHEGHVRRMGDLIGEDEN